MKSISEVRTEVGRDAPGEPVEDAADGRRVEEGHGRAQDVVQHRHVQLARRAHHTGRRDECVEQDEQRWKRDEGNLTFKQTGLQVLYSPR